MKLTDLELSDEQAAGFMRLVGKIATAHGASRSSSDLCVRTFGIDVKEGSVDQKARTLRVVASNEAIDSYDEIVKADWDLKRYRANPVVLYAHNSVGLSGPMAETLPIGKAVEIDVVGDRLEATLQFVTEKASPLAEQVWQGVVQGSLRAVSVGFRPGLVEQQKLEDGREIDVLSQNNLFEISVVPIPANPEAVARSAALNREQAKRLAARAAEPTPKPKAAEPQPVQEQPIMAMTDEEKQALETAKREASDARIALATAQGEHATELATERAKTAAEKARADKLDDQLCELEVKALVGKKITPAQVADMVEDRKAHGQAKFAERVARMPDLPHTKDVTGDDKVGSTLKRGSGASKRLADAAKSNTTP